MIKILTYIQRPADFRPDGYLETYRVQIAPELIEKYPEIVACTVNLVDDTQSGGLPGEKMPAEHAGGGGYVGVGEYWIEATPSRIGDITQALLAAPGHTDTYWVGERIAKDTPAASDLPVLRLMSPCRPLPGLSAPQVFESWERHIERANRVHFGMSRYIQNWHIAPLSDNAPQYFGTPMLSFQTMEAWENAFYVDAAGAQEIADDVASFVGSFAPLLTKEYRLRESPGAEKRPRVEVNSPVAGQP